MVLGKVFSLKDCSEGHDSGLLRTMLIGKRVSVVEDFKTLIEKAKKYGALIYVSTLTLQTYILSLNFNVKNLSENPQMVSIASWRTGYQGINIDAAYDF